MPFTGRTDLNIDPKGRMQIPAKVVSVLREEGLDAAAPWYAVPWPGRLKLYTKARYDEINAARQAGGHGGAAPGPKRQAFDLAFYALAQRIEPDSASRLMLPKEQVKRASLAQAVAVLGVGDHLEVWDRARWDEQEQKLFLSMESYSESEPPGTDGPG